MKTKTQPTKRTYRPVQYGALKFANSSIGIRYLKTHTKLSQTEIARRLNVTDACVSIVVSRM